MVDSSSNNSMRKATTGVQFWFTVTVTDY